MFIIAIILLLLYKIIYNFNLFILLFYSFGLFDLIFINIFQ